MKTEILKIKGNWQDVVNDCRETVGKENLDKEPSIKFKKEILISEHSPIREISIKWIWRSIKSWIAVHFSRHKWECYIKTQRTDRTGIDRDKLPQDNKVDFIGVANVQHCIDTSRKRLCRMASPETRRYVEDFKYTLHEIQPEIANVLVPNCIYRCGCPEPKNNRCQWYENMIKQYPDLSNTDIQTRYDCYNKIFYENFEKNNG